MPTFLPPLSHTSHVSPPSSASKPSFTKLDFHLTFDPQEDTSGRWEIWTDLPSLKEDGEPVSPEGEWHAITFSPLPSSSSDKAFPSSTSTAITLDAPLKEHATSHLTIFRARTIVAPKPGAAFAYTYRRVHPDGGIEWLGGSGSNGVIKISEDGSAHSEEDTQAPRKGYGLSVEPEGRSSPKIIAIPSSEPAQVQLAFFSPSPETHPGPFCSVVSDANPDAKAVPANGGYSVLVRADFQPFSVDQDPCEESVLRLTGDTPKLAVDAVLPGVPTLAAQVGPVDLSVEPSSESDTVTAFFLGTGRDKHLIVWADASDNVRSLTIKPHLGSFDKPHALLRDEDDPTFLPASEDAIAVHLSPGENTVHILRSLELDELSILDKGALWLAAPQARNVTPGEPTRAETDIADLLEDDATDGEQDEIQSTGRTERTERTEGVPELDSSEIPNESTDRSEAVCAPSSPQQSPNFLSVLFKLIGHLLAGVWEMFFPRPDSPKASIDGAASADASALTVDTASAADDEADESEAHTPVDERTPLLRIRRSESTLADTLSPASPPTAKLYNRLPSLDRLASLVRAPEPIKPSLQYSFESPPPATFFFAPQAGLGNVLERVSFQWRHKGSPWAPAAAKDSQMKGGKVRVEVGQAEETSGGDWEVRVEGK